MKRILNIGFVLLIVVGSLSTLAAEEAEDDMILTLSDGTRYIVHPSNFQSGGPPPDGIPSIDNPRFTSVVAADVWLDDDELVVLIERNDVARIYPLQILVWHEIVNDTIAGEPILVTYCPLCGSVIAFRREIAGDLVEFGTSGRLYNSNLIMYDRKTRSYWSQIGGRALVGELTGSELELVAAQTVFWGDWKSKLPEAEVLSRETGFRRSYGRDPYEGYESVRGLYFPVDNLDTSLHPKTVIYGIRVDGQYKAYRETELELLETTTDTVGTVEIEIRVDSGGSVEFIDTGTGAIIPFERDFWFAWAAFHPATELFGR